MSRKQYLITESMCSESHSVPNLATLLHTSSSPSLDRSRSSNDLKPTGGSATPDSIYSSQSDSSPKV